MDMSRAEFTDLLESKKAIGYFGFLTWNLGKNLTAFRVVKTDIIS